MQVQPEIFRNKEYANILVYLCFNRVFNRDGVLTDGAVVVLRINSLLSCVFDQTVRNSITHDTNKDPGRC
jgi:hypothetical protein